MVQTVSNMKQFIILFISLFIWACQPASNVEEASQAASENKSETMKPALIHTVYFWTKEGTTEEQLNAFEKGLEKLGTCPQILSYHWGPPAPTEARGVVDNSYAYAINSHFASVEDEKEYQTEPIHLEFIENHQDIWEKVVVYDNMVQ